jgi:Ca-activated chloride channel family protein
MTPTRKTRRPNLIAGAVAVFVVAAAAYAIQHGPPPAAPTSASAQSSGRGAVNPACIALIVAASLEKSAQLATLAGRFDDTHPATGGQCIDVRVEDVSSGAAVDALAKGWDSTSPAPRPDVWSPASTSWVNLLRTRMSEADAKRIVPDTSPSLLQSPLVIGMPKPMAQAMGWPDRPIGWKDIIAISRDPNGWARYGHTEWGRFRLGKTNPQLSTSGLNALVATYYAASGLKNDLSEADLVDPATVAFVADLERSVVHYGDTTNTFLANLLEADASGSGLSYISAVPVEEKQLIAYNQGQITGPGIKPGQRPSIPLVAIYPADGTLVADHPYVILTGAWVDQPKQAAAAQFLAFLKRPDQQRLFLDAGFRDHSGKPGPLVGGATWTSPDVKLIVDKPPAPAVLLQIERAWSDLRKPARVLFVLDVSGSMDDANKIGLMKAAAQQALTSLTNRDEVGLWTFPNRDSNETVYREVRPVSSLADHRAELNRDIAGLTAAGATPLYTTIGAAVAAMNKGADPERINAVVLLTDGQATDDGLDSLLRQLSDQARMDTGVRVFTIAYGADADKSTLTRVAAASRGAAYNASDPTSIGAVLTAVISNF